MRMSSESVTVTSVWLESQLPIKNSHTCYLHTAWSLEFGEPQTSVALAMYVGVMTGINFPCL